MPGRHVLRPPPRLRVQRQAVGIAARKTEAVAKARSVYYCTACGFESARWLGRCRTGEAWNTCEDARFVKPVKAAHGRVAPLRASGPLPLTAIEETRIARR